MHADIGYRLAYSVDATTVHRMNAKLGLYYFWPVSTGLITALKFKVEQSKQSLLEAKKIIIIWFYHY